MKYRPLFSLLVILSSLSSLAACADGADSEAICVLRPCHGLELTCESSDSGPDICTEEYRIGDACRSLASCTKESERCVLKLGTAFEECKRCTAECDKNGNGPQAFDCENRCLKAASIW